MVVPVLLGIVGMLLVALGFGLRAQCGSATVLACICGALAILGAAATAGSEWAIRIAVVCTYSAAGVFFGEAIARYTGPEDPAVATLEKHLPRLYKVLLPVTVAIAAVGIIMQLIEGPRPRAVVPLLGQALFLAALAVKAVLLNRTPSR